MELPTNPTGVASSTAEQVRSLVIRCHEANSYMYIAPIMKCLRDCFGVIIFLYMYKTSNSSYYLGFKCANSIIQ